jgi:predicted ester cyclase
LPVPPTNPEAIVADPPSKRLVRRFFEDVLTRQDAEVAGEIIAPEFVTHHPSMPPTPPGPEGVLRIAAGFHASFSELAYRVEQLVEEEDLVAARWTAGGVHHAAFMGVEAADRPVSIGGMDLFRIEGGRCAEAWVSSDFFGLFQQIGAFPPIAGAP